MVNVLGFFKRKQKGQGIVEYALLLAFVVGIAMMLNGANLGGAIKGVFDDVAAVLSGEEKIDFAAWSKKGKNQLHDYENDKDIIDDALRVKADQQTLANIGTYFIDKTRDQVKAALNNNDAASDEVLLVDYQDYSEKPENQTGDFDVHKGTDNTKGRVFNWMQGDYGENGYNNAYNFDSGTRYFLSNELIDHRDAAALAQTDNNGWGNNRSIRVKLTYENDTVVGAQVRVNRGARSSTGSEKGSHFYEYDITVNQDKSWSQTERGKTGRY